MVENKDSGFSQSITSPKQKLKIKEMSLVELPSEVTFLYIVLGVANR